MNLRLVFKFASILCLSSARARSRKPKSLKNLIYISVALALAAAMLSYFIGLNLPKNPTVMQTIVRFISLLPLLTLAIVLYYGLVFELYSGYSQSSIHAANWLPITPAEYVMASSLSTIFFTLPILLSLLGGLLTLSLALGLIFIYTFAAVISILSAFMGGVFVEILKTLIEKAAASISQRSGKLTLPLRLTVTILIVMAFACIGNTGALISSLGTISEIMEAGWMIPIFWPSLAIMQLAQSSPLPAIGFTVTTIILLGAIFEAGVYLRGKYWVPVEPTIRLGTGRYAPRKGLLRRLGLSPAETAVARKEFKTFFRRRDTVELLALPIIFIAVPLIYGWQRTMDPLNLLAQTLIGCTLFWILASSTSIGREKEGFANLLIAPIDPREILKGKFIASIIFSIAPTTIILLTISLILRLRLETMLALLAAGYIGIIETTAIGLVFGSRYPDFTTAPRARSITRMGLLLSMVTSVVAVALTWSPLIVYKLIHPDFLSIYSAVATTMIIGSIVTTIAYKSALQSLRELCISQGDLL